MGTTHFTPAHLVFKFDMKPEKGVTRSLLVRAISVIQRIKIFKRLDLTRSDDPKAAGCLVSLPSIGD